MALSCRLVCRELHDFINMYEPQIAHLTAVGERARLRSQIKTRREMVPSSLTDFALKAASWTKRRGLCPEEPSITIDSFTAWRLSDSAYRDMVKRGVEVEPGDLVTWGTLTTFLLRLQLDLQEDVDDRGERKISTLRHYAFPARAACDTATLLEYQRLCFMIWDRSVSDPFFSGQQHSSLRGEQGTFPKLLLTATSCHNGTRENMLRPKFARTDVRELRLPRLEDEKFFYYFEGRTHRDIGFVNRRMERPTPLKRASLLRMVGLF